MKRKKNYLNKTTIQNNSYKSIWANQDLGREHQRNDGIIKVNTNAKVNLEIDLNVVRILIVDTEIEAVKEIQIK